MLLYCSKFVICYIFKSFRPTNLLCPADGGTVIENGAYRKFTQCAQNKSTVIVKTDVSPTGTTQTSRKEEIVTSVTEITTKQSVSQRQRKASVGPIEPVAGVVNRKTQM